MAKKSLTARRREIGRQAMNIRTIIDANRFTKMQQKIFIFGYLHALISNKSTTDVVYQIAMFRPDSMLQELENFAKAK